MSTQSHIDAGLTLVREHCDASEAWRAAPLSPADASRRVLAYTPDGAATPHVVGKFYDDAAAAEHACNAMRFVHAELAQQQTANATLATPELLLHASALKFVAQRWAPGVLYSELISSAQFDRFIGQAGRALSELHALPPQNARGFCPVSTVDDHIGALMRPHPLALAEREPEFRPAVEAILAAVRAAANESVPAAPLHRDFHLRQIFFEPGRTWLIDLDLFGLGDPALDVGNFTVYLKTHLLQSAVPSAIQAFLTGYFDKRGDCGALLARVPVYQALTYLRMACKHYRLQQVSWRETTRRYLTDSAACFDKRERVFEGV